MMAKTIDQSSQTGSNYTLMCRFLSRRDANNFCLVEKTKTKVIISYPVGY